MRLLVVEDEIELRDAIVNGLRLEGYAVDFCSDGQEALNLICEESYNLIILDLNLPSLDGIEVLKEIRQFNSELKVLILSARSSVEDKVKGLDLGANDYLSKPFDFAELEARIRNLLKVKFIQEDNVLSVSNLRLDIAKKTVYVDSNLLELTNKEYAILYYLLLNRNRVISAEELIEHVWDASVDPFSGAIRVHISSLRKKLRDQMDQDIIETRIGMGYIIHEK